MAPCPTLTKQLHQLKDENLCLAILFWLYKKFQENESFIKTLEIIDVFAVIQDLIAEAKETYKHSSRIFFHLVKDIKNDTRKLILRFRNRD